MNAVQAHRGPDDVGGWERRFSDGSYVGLGSRRLAIIDLSPNGHMPMGNEDGKVWITYNGEIYNSASLRRELKSKGHDFRSVTDTEVILHLYEQEGVECVKRLNGMFAFAICDLRSGKPVLFLARDHFGIKPFYYAQRGRCLAFASEVKALLQVPGINSEFDFESFHQYLTFLWVPEPKTIFRGIRKLPPGHHAIFKSGELTLTKFWDLTYPFAGADYACSEAALAEQVRERFQRSVESQMVSDVPMGAFLSAGLDSCSIVAAIARAARRPVRTYTVTFPPKYRVGENTLDDPEIPALLARRLGCENQRIVVEPDVANLLPRLIWHMDDLLADPAIIPAYLICREASRQSTVLLSGVGGDELFAGYRKYSAHYWAQAYQKVPRRLRSWAETSVAKWPALRGMRLKGNMRLAKKMARSASLGPRQCFETNCTYLDEQQKLALYAPELAAHLAKADPYEDHEACFDALGSADFLNQMLYLDSKIFMPSLNLNYNDKMGMASSVEVRVPFLDKEFAEFVAWNVSPRMKLKGSWRPTTKHILRKAMDGILPKEVLRQPKAGLAAPVDYWLANDLREMVDDLLCESRIRQRGLFRPEAVKAYIDEHRRGAQDWSMQIWQFLTLELWMETFLDGSAGKLVETACSGERMATA